MRQTIIHEKFYKGNILLKDMVRGYKNYFKIALCGSLLIIILFLIYQFYFSIYMSLLFSTIFLLLTTEKGFTFYKQFFSKKAGFKFIMIILTLIVIASLRSREFDTEFIMSSILLVTIFGFPFIILQWKKNNIKNIAPTWRDFLTLLSIIVSPFIFSFLTSSQMFKMFYPKIMQPCLILLCLILFLVIRNFSREDIGYKLKIDIKDTVYIFVGFLLILLIYAVWEIGIDIVISKYILDYLYTGLKEKLSSLLSSSFNSYIHWIFFVGLGEELQFRGLLLGLIKKRLDYKWYGTLAALLISSLLFGFSHYFKYGLYGSLWIGLVGIVNGIIFIRTKRLVVPILLHALLGLS